jgi:hypothetical protein
VGSQSIVRDMMPEKGATYDLFVAAVGYERRARYVVQHLDPNAVHRVGIAFDDRQVLEYTRNYNLLVGRGYKVEVVPDRELERWLELQLNTHLAVGKEAVRVGVDISSFSRFRIAAIVESLRRFAAAKGRRCIAEFYYSVARFSKPPKKDGPNIAVGPVGASFAGWTTQPDLPLAAILGLGYEEDKALGAFEHVQASAMWIVKPISDDPKFDVAVKRANHRLLENTPAGRVLEYHVANLMECFGVIESLVFGLLRSYNVVLLPFGPKPLTLCSLLVAYAHPSVAVWRVSAGGFEEPVNRRASGHVYGLRAEFDYSETAGTDRDATEINE